MAGLRWSWQSLPDKATRAVSVTAWEAESSLRTAQEALAMNHMPNAAAQTIQMTRPRASAPPRR
ncbi:hypothetical protein B4N89_45125 [Embleya scabrispora]|uniref:Uncharacterized protein n=1 Tax=Embleya scabrispora TaxID=159449 RepID=A0A1T3NIM5_9ACTN|nr:hypothetical protein B4N89_45125 [Embleya scabrispora]